MYAVEITRSAEEDLASIGEYIAGNDSPQAAVYVLDRLEELYESLEQYPHRGTIVPELAELNEQRYHQLHFKPYRLIYRIDGEVVFILAILDGRRNMKDLLQWRLLR